MFFNARTTAIARTTLILVLLAGMLGLAPTRSTLAAPGDLARVSVSSAGLQGNGSSGSNAISADGRYVAFSSNASNLVSGDTNGTYDVFLVDRQTATTRRISVSAS